MAIGTIKTLVSAKGFGFITPDGGAGENNDLFFHQTSVIDGNFDDLQTGQQVSYDDEPDPRDAHRRRAANVALTGN
jgi:CspA family cold shock protein